MVLLPALSKQFWLLIGLALAPPKLAAAAAGAVTGAATTAGEAPSHAGGARRTAPAAAARAGWPTVAGFKRRRPATGLGDLGAVRQ